MEAKRKLLDKVYKAGKWLNQGSFMSAAIGVHPASLYGLVERDVDRCIDFGNNVLRDAGLPPILLKPEDDTGRCEDLWEVEEKPEPWKAHEGTIHWNDEPAELSLPDDPVDVSLPTEQAMKTFADLPTIESYSVDMELFESKIVEAEYPIFESEILKYETFDSGLVHEPTEPIMPDEDEDEDESADD